MAVASSLALRARAGVTGSGAGTVVTARIPLRCSLAATG